MPKLSVNQFDTLPVNPTGPTHAGPFSTPVTSPVGNVSSTPTYDKLTGQQTPVVDAKVANTVPGGFTGSVIKNDLSEVSPAVNIKWFDRTPAQTAAWRKENFNTKIPVSQDTFNKFAAAGGKAGAISKYGASKDAEIQEGLRRYYGFKPNQAMTTPPASGGGVGGMVTVAPSLPFTTTPAGLGGSGKAAAPLHLW